MYEFGTQSCRRDSAARQQRRELMFHKHRLARAMILLAARASVQGVIGTQAATDLKTLGL
jgi:hypothetical protein